MLLQVLCALVSQKLPPPASPPGRELTVSLFTITCPPPSLCHLSLMLFLFFLTKGSSTGHIPAGTPHGKLALGPGKQIFVSVFSAGSKIAPQFQDSSWLGFNKLASELKP